MATKRKKRSISDGVTAMSGDYFAASEAARSAIDNHPHVSDLRHGLTKAIDGTIKRYFSHKPLLKRKKK